MADLKGRGFMFWVLFCEEQAEKATKRAMDASDMYGICFRCFDFSIELFFNKFSLYLSVEYHFLYTCTTAPHLSIIFPEHLSK